MSRSHSFRAASRREIGPPPGTPAEAKQRLRSLADATPGLRSVANLPRPSVPLSVPGPRGWMLIGSAAAAGVLVARFPRLGKLLTKSAGKAAMKLLKWRSQRQAKHIMHELKFWED